MKTDMNDTFLRQVIFKLTNEIEDNQRERGDALTLLYPETTKVTVKVHNGSWVGSVTCTCRTDMYINVKHDRTGKVHRIYYKDITKNEPLQEVSK